MSRAAICVAAAGLCFALQADTQAAHPNVIWILLDACRADHLSCYGYERQTSPNIDKLAARGVVFEQHFSQANGTTLSVASYMCGKYFPVYCLGRGTWKALFRTPPDSELLLPEVLGESGYQTVCVTAHPWFSPESRVWKAFGDNLYVAPQTNRAYADLAMLNQAAFSWLDAHGDEPFFLYMHALDTHFPHAPRSPYDQWVDSAYLVERGTNPNLHTPPFGEQERAYLSALYDGDILYSDDQIARLVVKLKDLGIYEKTILVIGSDHGELLGEDGSTVGHPSQVSCDELFHVPLIMLGPGLPADKRVQALTENVDVMATVIDLLDIDTPARMDGMSLMPLIDGSKEQIRECAFARIPYGTDDDVPRMCLRSAEYRFDTNLKEGVERLYKAPDTIGAREECLAREPEQATRMRTRVREHYYPLWEHYATLPRDNVGMFTTKLERTAEPQDAWVESSLESPDDNKWSLASGRLRSSGFAEDAPPVTFRVEAPNGRWRVDLEADAQLSNPDGTRGSAFAVKAEGEHEFRRIVTDDATTKTQFLEIGVYRIDHGCFTVTLDEGSPNQWACAHGLRFIPVTEDVDAQAVSEQALRDEQLRALGYLD